MSELDYDRLSEWNKSVELMRELFPKWNTNLVQLDSWRDKFGVLNQEWFREALQLVYHRFNSDTPKPKWVQEAFKEVNAGHRGIPLDEAGSAGMQTHADMIKREQDEAIAIRDRCRA